MWEREEGEEWNEEEGRYGSRFHTALLFKIRVRGCGKEKEECIREEWNEKEGIYGSPFCTTLLFKIRVRGEGK